MVNNCVVDKGDPCILLVKQFVKNKISKPEHVLCFTSLLSVAAVKPAIEQKSVYDTKVTLHNTL